MYTNGIKMMHPTMAPTTIDFLICEPEHKIKKGKREDGKREKKEKRKKKKEKRIASFLLP
jgi:hypothetical protein